jgi:hypothetical protein
MNDQNRISLRPRSSEAAKCLICRDDFPDPTDQFQCPRCAASVHRECAGDGKCQVLGCVGNLPLGAEENIDQPFKTSTGWPAYESCLALILVLAILVAVISAIFKFNEKWTLPGLYAISLINLAAWAFYNLSQSLLLLSPIRNREDLPSSHRKLAIQGPINSGDTKLLDPNGTPCIYYKIEQQTYKTGKHSGWHNDSSEEFAIPFSILGVRVSNNPSEVYGLEEWTSSENPDDRIRFRIETLPLNKEITALGLFEFDPQNPKLINDNGIGLTLSTLSPYETAKQELYKALGQSLLAAFVAFLLWNELNV